MSVQNVRSIAKGASTASLISPVAVRGYNNYTFGTNLLVWDETNSYTLERIASDFGQPVGGGSTGNPMFRCGESAISAYDFGLVFSCMAAIVGAYTESGASVFTEHCDTSVPEVDVAWFGNNAVVFCKERNLIIPIKSADVQNACRHRKVQLENFVDTRVFQLTREKFSFLLDTAKGEALCRISIPLFVQKAFPSLFDSDPTNDVVSDDPNTPWDERSALGSLIASSVNLNSAEDTAQKYRDRVTLESVVVRTDLIFEPKVRYNSVTEFLGSLCYSDKDVIALAVNFRNNLFVYDPWFDGVGESIVQTDANPQFDKFFNVTEECKIVERFAQSVTNVPLTAAQFDVSVFEKVKSAFYEMELPCIKLASAFGRIVVPESVLVKGLSSMSGESIYCVVPVGVIGNDVICKNERGKLEAIVRAPWLNDDALYDITEVIK